MLLVVFTRVNWLITPSPSEPLGSLMGKGVRPYIHTTSQHTTINSTGVRLSNRLFGITRGKHHNSPLTPTSVCVNYRSPVHSPHKVSLMERISMRWCPRSVQQTLFHNVRYSINTLRPRQNHCHPFADDIFDCIFLTEIVWMSPKTSLKRGGGGGVLVSSAFPSQRFSNGKDFHAMVSSQCAADVIS